MIKKNCKNLTRNNGRLYCKVHNDGFGETWWTFHNCEECIDYWKEETK